LNGKAAVMSCVSAYHAADKPTKIIPETPKVMTMVSWKCPPRGGLKSTSTEHLHKCLLRGKSVELSPPTPFEIISLSFEQDYD